MPCIHVMCYLNPLICSINNILKDRLDQDLMLLYHQMNLDKTYNIRMHHRQEKGLFHNSKSVIFLLIEYSIVYNLVKLYEYDYASKNTFYYN